MTQQRQFIFREIQEELDYATKEWGIEFDRKNTANDWTAYVAKYVGQAVTFSWNIEQFRTNMIKAAGVCISAVEWCDRAAGNMPKRHYD